MAMFSATKALDDMSASVAERVLIELWEGHSGVRAQVLRHLAARTESRLPLTKRLHGLVELGYASADWEIRRAAIRVAYVISALGSQRSM
jgi:hypothetical protein